MKHRTIEGAINRLRQYAGYVGCSCAPEVHRSRAAGSHDRGDRGFITCARGDYIETIAELRNLRKAGKP